MKKQTAVEWLVDKYIKVGGISKEMVEKAKEMEKEQIIHVYSVGYNNGQVDSNRTAEQYYNETFKSE
jgi:hypothetical protein